MSRVNMLIKQCVCMVMALSPLPIWAQAEDSIQTPIDLVVVGPMVGTSFSVGVQLKTGVGIALDTLPDGLLLGRPVRVSSLDDGCSKAIAEKVAHDLVQSPPAVVIGHSCSAATISAAPVYAENKVLQITPASTNPLVTEMGIDTIFRMIGRDDVQGEMAAERMSKVYKDQQIGVLHFPSEYSLGLTQLAIRGLRARGIEPAKVIVSSPSATSYLAEIQELMAAGIEVLYIVGGGLDTGVFIRQSRLLDAPFKVISGDTLVSSVFYEAAGAAADEIPFTFPTDASQLGSASDAMTALTNAGHEPSGYTLLSYAAIQVWIEGVTRAQSLEADLVAAAIRSAPINTILGMISFDDKGDIQTSYPPFSWYVWRLGERVPID
ncbi:MAG: branched-chain amino acid ABC transporter substrate-binding protein [Pseudohongiella sp.]|nr:branched-chain amino acid ABC transporter substrate-binding protein [Pseudohongiella sp.]MDP2284583.1 branched-chain amino acid ABC transporter substrate-binding protein [Pseudohongiella sp.]